jgi:hypothetical protein
LPADLAWAVVLDDLDARLAAAESGDLSGLAGWTAPAEDLPAMTADETARASEIAERQARLGDALRMRSTRAAHARGTMHRASYRAADKPAVYVDRAL